MCQNKLNHTAEICDNLEEYDDIQADVQRSVTDYEALRGSLGIAPK